MRRNRLDEVIPIRLPRAHKVALRRIARRAGRDASALVREMIEQRIAEDQARAASEGAVASADVEDVGVAA